MSYTIFYWTHIFSYLTWLSALAASLYFTSKIRSEQEPGKKHKFMTWERHAASAGVYVGAVGILISGAAMASLPGGPQWGWFSIQLYPWLALKQLIFLLILLLAVISMRRNRIFWKALRGEDERERKRRKAGSKKTINNIGRKWSSAYRMSLLVYMLVVINTFLGLVKPYLLV